MLCQKEEEQEPKEQGPVVEKLLNAFQLFCMFIRYSKGGDMGGASQKCQSPGKSALNNSSYETGRWLWRMADDYGGWKMEMTMPTSPVFDNGSHEPISELKGGWNWGEKKDEHGTAHYWFNHSKDIRQEQQPHKPQGLTSCHMSVKTTLQLWFFFVFKFGIFVVFLLGIKNIIL